MRQHATVILLGWLLLATVVNGVVGWVSPHSQLRRPAVGISDPRFQIRCRQQLPRSPPSRYTFSTTTISTTSLYGFFDFLNPYDSKIPPELAEEIYRAEANTEAAKDRGTRIFVYTLLAILGIALASFNGFLTEVRVNGLPDETTGVVAAVAESTAGGGNNLDVLVQAGFGWVLENSLYKFIFTNKIGGAMCLLLGGGSALLAEAEFDSKRLNAEKIYEELERRRTAKTKPGSTARSQPNKKKRQSGKEKKSLRALSEVIDTSSSNESPVAEAPNDQTNATEAPTKDENESAAGGGVFGKMKDLYEMADSMAASQALLLNKRLEDAGVVEKITDETGLKVIGRENAKQIQQQRGRKKDKVDVDDKKGDLEP